MRDSVTKDPLSDVKIQKRERGTLWERVRPGSLLMLIATCAGALLVLSPFLLVVLNAFKSPAGLLHEGPLGAAGKV